MINKTFKGLVQDNPVYNKQLAEGLAYHRRRSIAGEVDRIYRVAANVGQFKYLRCRQCTPEEEFRVTVTASQTKGRFSILESWTVMYVFYFEFRGQVIERYIRLPAPGIAGLLMLRGSMYHISPVLSDLTISVEEGKLFIPLPRAKLVISRTQWTFLLNGVFSSADVVYSKLHNIKKSTLDENKSNNPDSVVCHATCILYMLCNSGLSGLFERYVQAEMRSGTIESLSELDTSEWAVCTSSSFEAPKNVSTPDGYTRTDFAIAVRSSDLVDRARGNLIRDVVASLFYIVDRYPVGMHAEFMDDPQHWKVILGNVIYNSGEVEGRISLEVDKHIDSLADYIDVIATAELKEAGIDATDIYDLLWYVVGNMFTIVTSANVTTMYDKYLLVMRFLLSDLHADIFKLRWKLTTVNHDTLTMQNLNMHLNTNLKTDRILTQLNKHAEVSYVDTPNASMIAKISAKTILQADSAKATKGAPKKNKYGGGHNTKEANRLDVSVAEVGSFLNLSKPYPVGKNQINSYLQISKSGRVLRDPRFKDHLTKFQKLIQR